MRLSGILLAALLPLAITGCSDDSNTSGSQDCADVKSITKGFQGCSSDGELNAYLVYDDCKDGRTLMVSGPVLGFVGEKAQHADAGVDSKEFKTLWSECYGYDPNNMFGTTDDAPGADESAEGTGN